MVWIMLIELKIKTNVLELSDIFICLLIYNEK